MTEIKPPPGWRSVSAVALNDAASPIVVGAVSDSVGYSRAFSWRDGELQLIPVPPSLAPTTVGEPNPRTIMDVKMSATDVNRAGMIVGNITPCRKGYSTGKPPQCSLNETQAWVFDGSNITLLADAASNAVAINDNGQIAGNTEPKSLGCDQGTVWRNGVVERTVDAPPGDNFECVTITGINDDGALVGYFDRRVNGTFAPQAVYWPPAGAGVVLPGRPSNASDINDASPPLIAGSVGQQVGVWTMGGGFNAVGDGFGAAVNDAGGMVSGRSLFRDGKQTDAKTLLADHPDWTSTTFHDINNAGAIVGHSGSADGTIHGFLIGGARKFSVSLQAEGALDEDDRFTLVLTISNGGKNAVKNIKFEYPEVVRAGNGGFLPKSTQGQLLRLSDVRPKLPKRLAKGEESVHTIEYSFDENNPGKTALYTEADAVDARTGKKVSDPHTVLVDSRGPGGYSRRSFAMGLMDNFIIETFERHLKQSKKDGLRIFDIGKKVLSPAERRKWFGDAKKLVITDYERGLAEIRGLAPEYVAATTMNSGPSQADQDAAFWEGMKEEAWRQGKERLTGLKDAGNATLKFGKDSVIESVMLTKYTFGQASPEERAQIEVMAMAYIEGRKETKKSLAGIGNYLLKGPTQEQVDKNWLTLTLNAEDIQAQLRQDEIKRGNVEKLFDSDPLKAQKGYGALTMEQMFPWMETGAQVIVGGGSEKLLGAATKKLAGSVRLAKATGALDETGKVTKLGSKVEPPSLAPAGPSPAKAVGARAAAGESLETLENIGGIPLREAEIQRQIIDEIEQELAADLKGMELNLALKPSSPLRKPNSVAKFELCKAKTGKPDHVALGLSEDALSEPSFFKPRPLKDTPGWDVMSSAQQQALKKEHAKAQAAWDDWHADTPTDPDIAKLKKATSYPGHELSEPVGFDLSHGRTGKALFEQVALDDGSFVIRAKYYETDGIKFLDSDVARPMGPDLDAVAITDKGRRARIADRQLENKVVRLYRKKIAERVRSGERFHGAEHGLTLIMDDVAAGPRGHVGFLMQYGLPYLPEETAKAFVERIAKFTEMSALEILGQVENFGLNVVNVTSKNVNYGKIPLDKWRRR